MKKLSRLQNTKSMAIGKSPVPSDSKSSQKAPPAYETSPKKAPLAKKEHKKSSKDVNKDLNNSTAALEKRIEEHTANKAEIESSIGEVCKMLRDAATALEEQLSGYVQQAYAEEETRLQESLSKMKAIQNDEEMSEKEKGKALREIKSTLCGVCKYELMRPKCEDVKKWAVDALSTEFRVCMNQSLSGKALVESDATISNVVEAGPNEVSIDIDFSCDNDDEMSGVEYVIEMWNGEDDEEEDEDQCIKSTQIVGPSHKASVEWLFEAESECKVRGRAIKRGLLGEECLSDWSEWENFTVPKKHKNTGAFGVGIAWKRRDDNEAYTVIDTATNEVLYSGNKNYTMVPLYVKGHKVVINGNKEDGSKWEETKVVEQVHKTPETLLEDMKLFRSDKDICKKSLEAITLRAQSSEEERTKIGNLGGIYVVSDVIRNHINSVALCKAGLCALNNIVRESPDVQYQAGESGCIGLIKEVIKQHLSNVDVCKSGLEAIGSIVYDNVSNQELAGESECIEMIKYVISQHEEDVGLCESGFLAITLIVFRNQANQKLAGKSKCIEFAKDFIKRYIDNPDICEAGLGAVDEIVFGNADNQKIAGKSKNIKIFKEAIEQHLDNPDVCQFGLRTIRSIVQDNPDNQKQAGKSKCIELVKKVIEKHVDNARICKYGLRAIGSITRNNPDNQKHACKAGCVELIKDVISNNINDPWLCENGVSSLGNIAHESFDIQNQAREAECIELVRDVIKQYIGKPDVCQAGLFTICEIAADNIENQKQAGELGCIELIKDAIKKHIDKAPVCQNGFAAIGNIIYAVAENQKRGCEAGCVGLVFDVIDKHKDKKSIAEWGCRCLIRLLSTQETHTKWCTVNVLKKVEECSGRYKDSLFIKKCLLCLKREVDPKVSDAIEDGTCTKGATACNEDGCRREKSNLFCVKCASPQKCFLCFECQGSKPCCEVCRKANHKKHDGAEFFDIITYC